MLKALSIQYTGENRCGKRYGRLGGDDKTSGRELLRVGSKYIGIICTSREKNNIK